MFACTIVSFNFLPRLLTRWLGRSDPLNGTVRFGAFFDDTRILLLNAMMAWDGMEGRILSASS